MVTGIAVLCTVPGLLPVYDRTAKVTNSDGIHKIKKQLMKIKDEKENGSCRKMQNY